MDVFLKFKVKNLTISGYYYNADGIGDAGLMFGSAINVNDNIEKVKSDGYYAQITYLIPKSSITLGINYGSSRVKDKIVDNSLKYSDEATRWTNSVTYAINPNIVLKSEYTIQGRHKVLAPKANVFSIGGFVIF